MSRTARTVFLLGSALLWGIVLLLGAEVLGHCWRRPGHQPYIRAWSSSGSPARHGRQPVLRAADEACATGSGGRPTRAPSPPGTPRRSARGRALSRWTGGRRPRVVVCRCWRFQGDFGAYAKPGQSLEECLGAEAAARARGCAGAADDFTAPLDGNRVFSCAPLRGTGRGAARSGAVLPNTRQPRTADDNDLWIPPSYLPAPAALQRVDVIGRAAQFSINNAGFRDDNVIRPKPPGVSASCAWARPPRRAVQRPDLSEPSGVLSQPRLAEAGGVVARAFRHHPTSVLKLADASCLSRT